MATTSEAEKSKSEEAPPSFKAAVWEYFGFSGKYNDESKIVHKVQFANIVMPLLATQVETLNTMSHLCCRHPYRWSWCKASPLLNENATITAVFQE